MRLDKKEPKTEVRTKIDLKKGMTMLVRIRRLFPPDCNIRSFVGSTQSLVHDNMFLSSQIRL